MVGTYRILKILVVWLVVMNSLEGMGSSHVLVVLWFVGYDLVLMWVVKYWSCGWLYKCMYWLVVFLAAVTGGGLFINVV